MKVSLFGYEVSIGRTAQQQKALSPVDNRGAWSPIIRESFAGAWQRGITVTQEDFSSYWAVFRCVGLIAGDIAKMRLRLVERQGVGGIWKEVEHDRFTPLLDKPNPKQTRIQFFRSWMESKLTRGNAYILKQRDEYGNVGALHVLDPGRCMVLLNEHGEVFYELLRDDWIGQQGHRIIVPASEIIHDRWNTLYHPLVGLSPIYAAGVNAMAALSIEKNSARLFRNSAHPGGLLIAPGAITDENAARLKKHFEDNYTGENAGKVAVLSDGLKYESMVMTAVDAQLIEQLRWNDEALAGVFGVPAHMLNSGQAPAYTNVESLQQVYYSQALQSHIEDIELLLDEGLGLNGMRGRKLGTEFDLDGLLRMDTATLVKTAGEGVKNGIFTPDEARAKLGLGPVPGGDTPYLQHQNYGLAALAKRDAMPNPFAVAPGPGPELPAVDEPDETDEAVRALEDGLAA